MKYLSSTDILKCISQTTSNLERAPQAAWDTLDPEHILRNIYCLEDCARAAQVPETTMREVLRDPSFPTLAARTRAVYGEWEKRDEDFHAHHLLAQSLNICGEHPEDIVRYIKTDAVHPNDTSLKQTASFAYQEGIALGLDSQSRVAFVGSGPFPESAISIATDFDCPVVGLDSDDHSNTIARELVRRFGLSHQIRFIHARGQEQSYEEYTHIYIAVLATDKATIVRKIFETNPKARVSCRTVRDLRTVIYEPLGTLPGTIHTERTITGNDPKTIMHSVILTNSN